MLLRRLLAIPLLLLGTSVVIFALIQLPPGGPEAVYAAAGTATTEDLARIRTSLGLDALVPVQYVRWLGRVVRGDLGRSVRDGSPVVEVLAQRVPSTLKLMAASLLVTLVISLPVAMFTATRRPGAARHVTNAATVLGLSIPTFWLAMLFIIVFATRLRWLPVGGEFTAGAEPSFLDGLRHLIAPAIVLAAVNVAIWTRFLHSSLVETLIQDFVRTARAKGLAERVVLWRHVFRHTLGTALTLLGLEVPRLFAGAIVTEAVFSWPGNGRLLVESMIERNYPVLMGNLMLIAFLVILGSVLADVTHTIVDPRVR